MAWYNANWAYRVKLTADNTKVVADISDDAFVIDLDNMPAAFFTNVQSGEIAGTGLSSDANLQGYWKLADVTDESSNSYDLTNNNSATFTTGLYGNCLDVENSGGEDQHLSIANASCANLEITGSKTYCCWIKPETIGADQVAMAKSEATGTNVVGLRVSSNNTVRFQVTGLTTNTTVSSTKTVTTGGWYHIAGVYDSTATTLSVFVNGVKASVTASGSSDDTDGDFAIGRLGAVDTQYFDGLIDDAAVFDRALTDEEVRTLYKGGGDIRITKTDGTTELAREVVKCATGSTAGEVWFKFSSTLSSSADTDIYVYYGNSAVVDYAVDDTYGAQNVWTKNYQGVWHMEEDGFDSSSNGYNLTNNNGITFDAGKTGGAAGHFNGSNQYFNIADASCPNLEISTNKTIMSWLNFDTHTAASYPVAKSKSDASALYGIRYLTVPQSFDAIASGLTPNQLVSNVEATNGAWTNVVFVHDSTNTTLGVTINGTEYSTSSTGTTTDTNGDFGIGRPGSYNGLYFDGLADAVRVLNVAMNDNDIDTHYNNENSNSTFFTFGTQETDTGTAATGYMVMGKFWGM